MKFLRLLSSITIIIHLPLINMSSIQSPSALFYIIYNAIGSSSIEVILSCSSILTDASMLYFSIWLLHNRDNHMVHLAFKTIVKFYTQFKIIQQIYFVNVITWSIMFSHKICGTETKNICRRYTLKQFIIKEPCK